MDRTWGSAQVLIVSDEPMPAGTWARSLNERLIPALAVKLEANFAEVYPCYNYYVIIVDVNRHLPDAISICHRIRLEFSNPVLLCTYESDERLQLEAYLAGVDEYIAKPIGVGLLVAKITAWLRQASVTGAVAVRLERGVLQIDENQRTLKTPEGCTVHLSSLELRLLMLLLSNKGKVMEPSAIVEHVWAGLEETGTDRLKNLIYRLRRKIEVVSDKPLRIETVAGNGYRFLG